MSAAATVRLATGADLDAIAALEAIAFPTPWAAADLRAELSEPRTRLTVATVDDRVVGHLLAWCVAGEAEILSTAVAPTSRRRGVGHALMGELVAWAAAGGAARIHLDVRRDNVAARALYAAHAFVEVGVRTGYYDDGAVDGILMSLAVTAPV